MAFLTLFRVSTGDNWSGIMKVVFLFFPSAPQELLRGCADDKSWCLCLGLYEHVSKYRLCYIVT